MKKLIPILIGAALVSGFRNTTSNLAYQRVEKVMNSTNKITTLTYDFIKSERFDDKMVNQHVAVKIQRNPFKVYLKEVSPHAGVEVLYPYAAEPSKALVHPNGFPWVNLKLDPNGDLMRKNQHHTIRESGFDYVMSILAYTFDKYETTLDEIVAFEGIAIVDGHQCEVFTLTNPNFGYINHTISNDENLLDIAEKNKLSAQMILNKNTQLKSYYDTKNGDVIRVPNDYSSKMIFYVDQEKQVPVLMKIYDDEGLFEQYEFKNLVVNPMLTEEEFSETYVAYGF